MLNTLSGGCFNFFFFFFSSTTRALWLWHSSNKCCPIGIVQKACCGDFFFLFLLFNWLVLAVWSAACRAGSGINVSPSHSDPCTIRMLLHNCHPVKEKGEGKWRWEYRDRNFNPRYILSSCDEPLANNWSCWNKALLLGGAWLDEHSYLMQKMCWFQEISPLGEDI